MKLHRNLALSWEGRRLLARRVGEQGWTVVIRIGATAPVTPTSCRLILGTGLGDRFGSPRGSSGTVKPTIEHGAKPVSSGETQTASGLCWRSADTRILHGKEGVDGSSPSEGFFR
jgi:hypothetical protein